MAIVVQQGHTETILLAEGDGVGDIKAEVARPGIWIFDTLDGPIRTHLDQLDRTDEITTRVVSAEVLVTRLDSGATQKESSACVSKLIWMP